MISADEFFERRCRICGCTEYAPCPGGCFWVEHDLCSSCAIGRELGKAARRGVAR